MSTQQPPKPPSDALVFIVRFYMLPWTIIRSLAPGNTGETIATIVMWLWTFLLLGLALPLVLPLLRLISGLAYGV